MRQAIATAGVMLVLGCAAPEALIRGSMKHWGAGESEATAPILQPGSYWFQPGGAVHGDSCLDDACLVHLVWSGARDGQLAPDSTR